MKSVRCADTCDAHLFLERVFFRSCLFFSRNSTFFLMRTKIIESCVEVGSHSMLE